MLICPRTELTITFVISYGSVPKHNRYFAVSAGTSDSSRKKTACRYTHSGEGSSLGTSGPRARVTCEVRTWVHEQLYSRYIYHAILFRAHWSSQVVGRYFTVLCAARRYDLRGDLNQNSENYRGEAAGLDSIQF